MKTSREMVPESVLHEIEHDARMSYVEPQRSAVRLHAEYYDEVCSLWRSKLRRMWGRNTWGLAQVYEDIAELRQRQGRDLEAKQSLERAAKAWRRGREALSLGAKRVSNGILVDDSLRWEAWCLGKLGCFDDAHRLLLQIWRRRNRDAFAEHFEIVAKRYPDVWPRAAGILK